MAQKLTTDAILGKEFNIDFKGYSAVEVDQFLDDVMQDYEFFEGIIKEQKELLDRYEESLAQQRRMLLEHEGKNRAQSEQAPSQFSHVDILKRVSRLEEAVFNTKE
ncbi:DivIVA domain-containing protein [Erysipelothrix sp. HDW6C]|uniref:DivIVA domain-containing protein n=1 Tax=Erysipelothrix sp. HDW6C TaxID=2714930 RepID=UPI00140AF121|nr:DivIVA domain-containing protein [Erysipelothrix sp. HDW6C]QIK69991.1 DivIVA domain-containing protein [Erysipelothrix sp. HDW6C]